MASTVDEIMACMENIAPRTLKEDWDNVGLLVGEGGEKPVCRVLFALDACDGVIDEAIKAKCSLIITHHPIIFGSIKSVTDATPLGRRIIKLIKHDISVFSAHTNFDICPFGTNTYLANLLGLCNTDNLCTPKDGVNGLGKVGILEKEMAFSDFVRHVKEKLGLKNAAAVGDCNKIIKKVGLCTGSGADREFFDIAKIAGCDAYVTGDLKFHDAQYAKDIGLCVVDATHYSSEVLAMGHLADEVAKRVDVECIVSEFDGQVIRSV